MDLVHVHMRRVGVTGESPVSTVDAQCSLEGVKDSEELVSREFSRHYGPEADGSLVRATVTFSDGSVENFIVGALLDGFVRVVKAPATSPIEEADPKVLDRILKRELTVINAAEVAEDSADLKALYGAKEEAQLVVLRCVNDAYNAQAAASDTSAVQAQLPESVCAAWKAYRDICDRLARRDYVVKRFAVLDGDGVPTVIGAPVEASN